jgi:hypothetical protein
MLPGAMDEDLIMLATILIVVLVLLFLGTIPRWPHSRTWGYFPSTGLGLLMLIVLILLWQGRLRF